MLGSHAYRLVFIVKRVGFAFDFFKQAQRAGVGFLVRLESGIFCHNDYSLRCDKREGKRGRILAASASLSGFQFAHFLRKRPNRLIKLDVFTNAFHLTRTV